VRVHGDAQVTHDPLADRGGQQRLIDADDRADHGDADHAQCEQCQQPGVPVRQGVVDDAAQEEWRAEADQRGRGDEQADQDEAAGVRAEEAEDPAGIHVRVVRADVREWGHAVSWISEVDSQ
jgi:hypothetical protein